MAPKKKGKGGGGKKGKAGKEKIDPEDLKAYNLAERETLMALYNSMRDLADKNTELRGGNRIAVYENEFEEKDFVS